MGYLKERYGATLIGEPPEGTCPVCAHDHDPDLPHNLHSLAYQYRFYDEHGRFPTWKDAMAHCDGETQALWTLALKEQGVEVR